MKKIYRSLNRKHFLILLVWNIVWSVVAIPETIKATSYAFGYEVDQSLQNGSSFETFVYKASNLNQDSEGVDTNLKCAGEAWLNEFNYNFDSENSTLNISINENTLSKISNFYIKQVPKKTRSLDTGFSFLNFKEIKFSLDNGKASIPIDIVKTKNELDYPVELLLTGYTGSSLCLEYSLLIISKYNFSNYSNPVALLVKDTISDANLKYPDINGSILSENLYVQEFLQKKGLSKLHNQLPKANEATIALLHADVDGWSTEYTWDVKNYINIYKINSELVIGMYGNVQKEDLLHLNKLIDTLRIVAPELKVSYSEDFEYVTLPIILTDCTKEFSALFNDCYESLWGVYYPNESTQHGRIWVDSSLPEDTRLSVITHELGHALGLNHNLCIDSVMSYSEFSSEDEKYFRHIDLMQLQAIYDPSITDKRSFIGKTDFTETLDLDIKKIDKFTSDIQSTCYQKPKAYDFLIDFQESDNY